MRITRKSPWRAAADAGDRYVRVFVHECVPLLVIGGPFHDVVLQLLHQRYCIDDAGTMSERRVSDRSSHRDPQPDCAHVCSGYPQTGWLYEQCIIGGHAMGHHILAAGPVTGILNALELFDGRLFDLADYTAQRNVTLQFQPG